MSINDDFPASTHNSEIPVKKPTKDIPYPMKIYQNVTSSIASSIAIIVAAAALFGYSDRWIDKTTLQIEHQFAVAELNRQMEDARREQEAKIEKLKIDAGFMETYWQLRSVGAIRSGD